MIALTCACEKSKKNGKDRRGNQRFKCVDCGRTWTEKKAKPLGDMRIDQGRAVMALKMLLEGMSIRATERITSLHSDTIEDPSMSREVHHYLTRRASRNHDRRRRRQ